MNNTENLLITGGLGFIGTSLALELIALGYSPIILDIKKKDTFVKRFNGDARFIHGDITDHRIWKRLFRDFKIDGIVHLAAVSRVIDAQLNPERCRKVNIDGINLLFSALRKSGQYPWLIYGSSREVYGEPKQLPVKESDERQAINVYGHTKIVGEHLFSEYAKSKGTGCVVLRFSNVYGNEFDIMDRVLPRFIKCAHERVPITIQGGNQVIDFTYIEDTVNGITKSIERLQKYPKMINDFHISPGIGWSLYELKSFIEELCERELCVQVENERDYDVTRFIGDPKKANEILKIGKLDTLQAGLQKSLIKYTTHFNKTTLAKLDSR
jgi:nucleoside-diphosphate-sugar epimerase